VSRLGREEDVGVEISGIRRPLTDGSRGEAIVDISEDMSQVRCYYGEGYDIDYPKSVSNAGDSGTVNQALEEVNIKKVVPNHVCQPCSKAENIGSIIYFTHNFSPRLRKAHKVSVHNLRVPEMAVPSLAQLTISLTSLGLPTLSPAFLTPILSSTQQRQQPLHALVATAKHRLLSANISSPQNPNNMFPPSSPSLPPNVSSVQSQQSVLRHDIFVQVLDIEDLGRSKWEQIEALESERNGELKKGREIIRVIPQDDDDDGAPSSAFTPNFPHPTSNPTQAQAAPKGPFKLLLQDHTGMRIYGFELRKVDKIGFPPVMNIGCKLMLKKGARIARGVVLLEPEAVVVFGGKIDGLDKDWREGREQRLRRAVEAEREAAKRE
jgi:RecQ-mediated genome instability protein 1